MKKLLTILGCLTIIHFVSCSDANGELKYLECNGKQYEVLYEKSEMQWRKKMVSDEEGQLYYVYENVRTGKITVDTQDDYGDIVTHTIKNKK